MAPSVAIVGGGLAGLTCALSLGRAGFEVTVHESTEALGGKAGVRRTGDQVRPGSDFPYPCEHGPHFVAAWYVSTLRLLRELGMADRLVDYSGISYLLPTSPRAASPRKIEVGASLRLLPKLVTGLARSDGGPLSRRTSLRVAALAFDLLADRARIEATEDMSLADYAKGRRYGSEDLLAAADDQVLRASAIPARRVSLRTMAGLMTLWFQYPAPFLRVLDSDLHTALIDPLARAVEAVARIRLRSPVRGLAFAGDGRVDGVEHDDGSVSRADLVVSAVPCEVLSSWLSREPAAGELRGLTDLETAPMCAVQLVFDGKLRGVPPGVFYLWESEPAINAIDLSQVWSSLAGERRTFLSVVISDHSAIAGLGDAELVELTLERLSRCIPDVSRVRLHSAATKTNTGEPLFINTTGSWRDRPSPSRGYAKGSLYVTGDFAQTPVDLACMEGAVASGMIAAEAIASRYARFPGLTAALPRSPSRGRLLAYRAMRAGLTAIIAAAGRLSSAGR